MGGDEIIYRDILQQAVGKSLSFQAAESFQMLILRKGCPEMGSLSIILEYSDRKI